MRAIVKIQVPLATNDPQRLALIYAENRINMTQQQLSKETLEALGDDVKGYFLAEFIHTRRRWTIGKRVEDQPW